MTCGRCRKSFDPSKAHCPHCGAPNAALSGVYRTSAVFISAGRDDVVYRSLEDVPPQLRTRLQKSTNSPNAQTILIADRRGRNEIAKAIRGLPDDAQRRLLRAVLGEEAVPEESAWTSPRRKALVAAAIFSLALIVVALVFLIHWN